MSYSIYKHEATLKMAFEAIFLGGEILSGPPTNAYHHVVLLCMSLGVRFPRLAKSLTGSLESGLVDLAVALDDVDLTSGAVGEHGDLPCALVPAHRSSASAESLDKDDGFVGGHGKAIGKCLVVECFAPLLENG